MNRSIFFRAPGIVFLSLFFLLSTSSTSAQSTKLSVVIQTLTQNETIFVSPSAYLYSVFVNGWVVTSNPEPSLVKVRLDLLQNDLVTASLSSRANSDGSFSFSVTANPDATDFNDLHTGCIACHFASSIAFPPGKVLVRVTAIEPSGNQATAERTVIVDHSVTAIVPVRLVDNEHPERKIANVPVLGTTRLYMWRTHTSSATTDASGLVRLQVESLSQANTRYIFNVPSVVVNGVLYASVESKQIVLKPGQAESEPVTLLVRARRGEISGTLRGASDASLTVRAMDANTGATFTTQSRGNTFAFADLPVTAYWIALDPNELAMRSLQANATLVDLTSTPLAQSSITLNTSHASPRVVRGTIRTTSGEPASFAWVEIESNVARTNPDTGEFVLFDVPANAQTLRIVAPGFWSQSIAIKNDAPLSVTLVPRNELRSIAWGKGTMRIPSETLTDSTNNHLILIHGWMWGKGTGTFSFEAAGATITLDDARIAIERQAERAWLYVIEGKASVTFDSAHQATLNAGQMLAIDAHSKILHAVAIDPLVIRTLSPTLAVPSDFAIEPTLDAQMNEWVTRFGINVAQLVTFATYLVITLALVSTPFVVWAFVRRFRL